MGPRLLIVGADGGSNVGGSFLRGALSLGIAATLCDTAAAWNTGAAVQKLLWHFAGRRPQRLPQFSESVLEACGEHSPHVLLSTGRAPLTEQTLSECKARGIRCVNFSTDDPFNRRMHSRWFLKTLALYDTIYSPRRSNMSELRAYGCSDVRYMPFGYDPELFFLDESTDEPPDAHDALFFAGIAEVSRLRYVESLIRADLQLRLYGSRWNRYATTRSMARGEATIPTIRREIKDCSVSLCFVRHDNRDGHSMRTFELPACKACMLVEDTDEHREFFGYDEERVVFFDSPAALVSQAKRLLRDRPLRTRLRAAVHHWVVAGRNTYADRLAEMMEQPEPCKE